MIRFLINGTRADGERMAKRFGVNHIGFEPPGIGEGQIGINVIGTCDEEYFDQLMDWYNSDDGALTGHLPPGSVVWVTEPKANVPRIIVPGKTTSG